MPRATPPRVVTAKTATSTVPEIRGKIGRYRVRDIAEVDANLRGLADWLAQRLAAPGVHARDLQRFREDQSDLLDARLKLMAERDAAGDTAA